MLGRGLIGLAIAASAYALVASLSSLGRDRATSAWRVVRTDLYSTARRAMVVAAFATAAAAVVLWYAFFTRDFAVAYVAQNTSRATQPWYTFSALWSGMAGSLLLWSLIGTVFAAVFVSARRGSPREPYVACAIPVLCAAQLFYLVITFGPSNPFARSDLVPFDGRGMNPLLHSPGMLIHPPLLYIGLVGLSVPFAITVSALINGRTGTEWIVVVRRWTLVAWLTLGSGLVLGGAWAYTELGWGGYWGWDPVENAAFMPWLAATAFLHSAMVQERRGMLRVWNVFLVVAAAALATFGAFLTRSGLLSSVHTFAESPIGRWFFLYLALQTVGALALLVWRLPRLRSEAAFGSAVSKEAAFLVNNLVFVGACAVVLWGTLLPLASEAVTGEQIAVGPPFFNRVFAPIGALLLLLASFGTVVPWRSGSLGRIARRLRLAAAIATASALGAVVISRQPAFAGVVWIAVLLGATSAIEIARAARAHRRLEGRTRGLLRRNPRRYGGYVVHLGVAIMVVGFAGSIGRTQTEVSVAEGDSFRFAGYTFTYERLERSTPADKDVNLAVLHLRRDGGHVVTLRPQLNFHRDWEQPQSEIAIRSTPMADTYVILAGTADDGEAVFRVHHNPLVMWVWAGAAVALAGGLAALVLRPRRPGDRADVQAAVEVAS